MIETYEEAGVDPLDINFFESHGTGTNVGDPQEAKAIADAYCKDRKVIYSLFSNNLNFIYQNFFKFLDAFTFGSS